MTDFQAALDKIYNYFEERGLPIYQDLLRYLDETEDGNDQNNFDELVKTIKDHKVTENEAELDDFLRLLSKLAANHHRSKNFFPRIVRLLEVFKSEIAEHYTNEELFSLFLRQEPIALLLQEKGMLNLEDNEIKSILLSQDNADVNNYYHPKDVPNPEEFQKVGENHSLLCTLIRKQQTHEFISYINTNNIKPEKKIDPSPFETNAFLKNKSDVTLFQYAIFSGSVPVFTAIVEKSPELLDSPVWEYAILGKSHDILLTLKDKKVAPPDDNFAQCLELSVTSHNNDFTDILQDDYVQPEPEPQNQDQEQDDDQSAPPPKHLLDPLLRAGIMAHNFVAVSRLIKDVDEKALNELFQISCKAGFHIITDSIINLPGIKINACGKTSALHKAVNIGDINTVKLLLKNPEIDINQQSVTFVHDVTTQDYDGLTALERSIRYGHNKIVDELLKHEKIDVNKKSRWRGNAPLHICAKFGNAKAAELILQKGGADVNVQCHDEYRINNGLVLSGGRETPLHYAAQFNHPEVAKLLLQCSEIKPDLQNWNQKKPIECTENPEVKGLFPQ